MCFKKFEEFTLSMPDNTEKLRLMLAVCHERYRLCFTVIRLKVKRAQDKKKDREKNHRRRRQQTVEQAIKNLQKQMKE